MSKEAEDLIRARDNLRELQKVGKETRADVERVKSADKAYTDSKNK